MATATIDGLDVSYKTCGSGPALLMLAPGGFDATMERWSLSGVWKGMRPFETLSEHFTLVAYDRRESGASGGRIERLSWALFADQAKALLDHLKISDAYIMGGCMGCSVALAFAARYPKTARALTCTGRSAAIAGRSTPATALHGTCALRASTSSTA